MSFLSRLLCTTVIGFGVAHVSATDAPKDSPLGQAGTPAVAGHKLENLEFAGVTTVGKKTTITLYDKQQKTNFWIEAGKTTGDITVVKYDNDHDQVTIRSNGMEKTLPLRPPSAVVNGAVAAVPVPTPALSAGAPTGAATPTSTTTLSQARQEEEARMLVSDLLEIGMAQRHAYEEAQRKAASGQTVQGQTTQPVPATQGTQPGAIYNTPAQTGAAQSTSAQTNTPSGG
jgi:hypothetical protein